MATTLSRMENGYIKTVSIRDEALRFGYSVQINMSLSIERFNRLASSWDNGQQYDYRTAEFTLSLTGDEARQISEFLKVPYDLTPNSPETFNIILSPSSGFFIAGPDMGDSGTFTISLLDNGYSAMKVNPFNEFDCKMKVLFHGLPQSSAQQTISVSWFPTEFKIGDVVGLRDPQISPKQEFAVKRSVSAGGQPFTVSLQRTDEATTQLDISDTTQSMAAIVSYLQNMARGNTFMLRGGDNFWPFGGARANNPKQWPVRLLDNTITAIHSEWDLWTTSLQLWNAEAMP